MEAKLSQSSLRSLDSRYIKRLKIGPEGKPQIGVSSWPTGIDMRLLVGGTTATSAVLDFQTCMF
jgi:hypothetical protein